MSYLTNNTKIIMSMYEQANQLLAEWDEIDLDNDNISFLAKTQSHEEVGAPSGDEKKKIEEIQNKEEELSLIEDEYDLLELYDYDENDIEKYVNKVIKAFKYTEMISKAISGFHNTLKSQQKQELVQGLYEFPNKILYTLLKPIDDDYDNCVNNLKSFADSLGAKDKQGKQISEDTIKQMITQSALIMILNVYNNMAYLSTDRKSLDLINSYDFKNINHRIFNLMSLENYGDTDLFAKKAEELMYTNKNPNVDNMIRQIVRKHLIWTSGINFRNRQQLTDKFFNTRNKQQRLRFQKQFLIEQNKDREV